MDGGKAGTRETASRRNNYAWALAAQPTAGSLGINPSRTRIQAMKRDEWVFLGRMALLGFIFPMLWALLVPIALELYSESRMARTVDTGIA